jgi:chromosome segregation ATPase
LSLGNITELRDRWLESLESLVGRIAVRFSHYFESMGFAGDVALGRGTHLNDFANYGIDILVKFRTNEPLQRLTPHQQSGGERSVATALYMLALQVGEKESVFFNCVEWDGYL